MARFPRTGRRLHGVKGALLKAMVALCLTASPAMAAEPAKIGFSMALTGSVAANGKQLLAALELWRDDVNAHGGLLNRQVELVYYDDQSNPNSVPAIYTKLISVDKIDAVLGPYATSPRPSGLALIPWVSISFPSAMPPGRYCRNPWKRPGSFEDDKRAQYMRGHSFRTVVGDIAFGNDGEWAKSRMFFTQFQNVAPNNLEQFRDGSKQIILSPREYKTGDMI